MTAAARYVSINALEPFKALLMMSASVPTQEGAR